jgi:hypothetical protein
MGLITSVDFCFAKKKLQKKNRKKKEEISPPSPPFNKERSKRACLLACTFGILQIWI